MEDLNGLMHPSSTDAVRSMTKSGENSLWIPSPWQFGQAPSGLLKENTRGDISGRKAPCSGQANSSEYGIIWPSSVVSASSLRIPFPLLFFKLSTAIVPPPRRSPDSIASVNFPLYRAAH